MTHLAQPRLDMSACSTVPPASLLREPVPACASPVQSLRAGRRVETVTPARNYALASFSFPPNALQGACTRTWMWRRCGRWTSCCGVGARCWRSCRPPGGCATTSPTPGWPRRPATSSGGCVCFACKFLQTSTCTRRTAVGSMHCKGTCAHQYEYHAADAVATHECQSAAVVLVHCEARARGRCSASQPGPSALTQTSASVTSAGAAGRGVAACDVPRSCLNPERLSRRPAQFCWAHTMLEFRPDITEGDYFNEGIERVTGEPPPGVAPSCCTKLQAPPARSCRHRLHECRCQHSLASPGGPPPAYCSPARYPSQSTTPCRGDAGDTRCWCNRLSHLLSRPQGVDGKPRPVHRNSSY